MPHVRAHNIPMRSSPLPNDDDDDGEDRPSKTELKRQMHSLQQLGAELAALPESRLDKLALDERLRDAIDEYRRTRSHEGRRRQLQFIGKLMRFTDEAPLREAVAESKLGSARETLALHEAERWRDELIASDDAVTRWIEHHPDTDVQALRSLVRSARKGGQTQPAHGTPERQGRAYRDLFQIIKAALASDRAAAEADDPDDDVDD